MVSIKQLNGWSHFSRLSQRRGSAGWRPHSSGRGPDNKMCHQISRCIPQGEEGDEKGKKEGSGRTLSRFQDILTRSTRWPMRKKKWMKSGMGPAKKEKTCLEICFANNPMTHHRCKEEKYPAKGRFQILRTSAEIDLWISFNINTVFSILSAWNSLAAGQEKIQPGKAGKIRKNARWNRWILIWMSFCKNKFIFDWKTLPPPLRNADPVYWLAFNTSAWI